MIAFSSDIDWAPEAVIKDMLALFEKYGVKCTLFSTHQSDVLARCNKKLFEIGIHPNFNEILSGNSDKSVEDVIDDMLEIHPDARGVRSHSMLQSTNILQKFADKNLVYDANHFMPYHTGIKPFRLWNGMIRIPYNWEDDVHWSYGYSFESSGMNLNDPGLVVFDFHPIHIYLNTENKYRYNAAKNFYQDPEKLIEYRNTETKGARDLLISLLEYVQKSKIEHMTLLEIANAFIYGGIA